jgi:adenosine/AMP kinase
MASGRAVAAVPGFKFGLALCEASGKCLVRWSGTDPAMTELAKKNAAALGAGHSFIIFLGDGFYPLNVLNYSSSARVNPGNQLHRFRSAASNFSRALGSTGFVRW